MGYHKVKLNIGCGRQIKEGYINIDRYVMDGSTLRADSLQLPFANNTVDEIICIHQLEHLRYQDVVPGVKEWYRVLRKGGKILVEVPDFEWCAKKWLEATEKDGWTEVDWGKDHRFGFWTMALWGNQEHNGEFHKCPFTQKRLHSLLGCVGFTEIRTSFIFSHDVQSIESTAIK